MPKIFPRLCSFAALSLFATIASASNPMIGAEMGVIVARKMFAAPPLPNLDGGGVSISAQYGQVDAKSKLDIIASDGSNVKSTGGAKGNTAGVGLSIPTKSDWGFFLFAIQNRISGETIVNQNGAESYRISNINADTLATAGGISYRWLGTEKSTFAVAPFVGPYYMQVHATSDFVPPSAGGGSATHFSVDPTIYGLFEGIQMVIRLGKFRINPYLLASQDSSNRCRDVKAEGPTLLYNCSDGTLGKMDVDGTMIGAGLFLGFGPFRINIFSVIPENPDVEVTHYSGSLSYEF